MRAVGFLLCVCYGSLIGLCRGQDDSLRGALEALSLRQRELARYHPQHPHTRYQVAPEEEDFEIFPGQAVNTDDVYGPRPYYPEKQPPRDRDVDRVLLKYLENELDREDEPRYIPANTPTAFRERETAPRILNKRGSAFRERNGEPQVNNQLAELFLKNLEEDEQEEAREQEKIEKNAKYTEMIDEILNSYKQNRGGGDENDISEFGRNEVKRQLPGDYAPAGWGPIAFKKRRSHDKEDMENDLMYALKYMPSDAFDRYVEENSESNNIPVLNTRRGPDVWYPVYHGSATGTNLPYKRNEGSRGQQEAPYAVFNDRNKRFPVTKRSGDFYSSHQKRSADKLDYKDRKSHKKMQPGEGTDEKVVKDLSSIFGMKKKTLSSKKEGIPKPEKRSSETEHKSNSTEHSQHESHDEHMKHSRAPLEILKEDQIVPAAALEVKKKSIRWSDYVGLDKRNKKYGPVATEDKINNDWLMQQYYSALSKAAINSELDDYPLQSFKHHGDKREGFYEPFDTRNFNIDNKRDFSVVGKVSSDDIDGKLKSIEDALIDDALKYTGAHQGNPHEYQQVKEMVMSKLATAYGLEQMRQALDDDSNDVMEQKSSTRKEYDDDKRKRVAVKKEKAQLPDKEDKNNVTDDKKKRIKTFDRDGDSGFEDEQGTGQFLNGPMSVIEPLSEGYMGGSGMRHQQEIDLASDGECPVLDLIIRRCRSVDILAGDHGQLFLPLCSLHQICYLCGPQSGASTPTACDLMFLSEADSLCQRDGACQRAARAAVMSLRELHDSTTDDLAGECEHSPCLGQFLEQNRNAAAVLRR